MTDDGCTQIIDMRGSQTLSVAEAAELLGVSKGLLYERARVDGFVAPGIPFLTIGTRLRIPKAKLLAYAAGDWQSEDES